MKGFVLGTIVALGLWASIGEAKTVHRGPSQEKVEDLKDAPLLAPKSDGPTLSETELLGTLGDSQLLLVGVRIDTAFSGGGSVMQGFSIPSLRLTAAGEVGEHIGYRLSFGQTREWSSLLLPQILPVEAYIDFHSASEGKWDRDNHVRWRVGMFTPTFNPMWTPDLSDLPLPDYNESHRLLFIGRDIGTELTFEPAGGALSVTGGVFNGNGIIAANTNNSRAFTGSAKLMGNLGQLRFAFGVAGYSLQQSTSGTANFKQNVVANAFLWLDVAPLNLELTAEAITGRVLDSVRLANPVGGAGTLLFDLGGWVKLFARFEKLQSAGVGSGQLVHAQVGPVLEFHRSVKAYLLYDYLDVGGVGVENTGLVRMRLNL